MKLCVCVCSEAKKECQGAFQVMRESSFGKYFSHFASVCTFVYWIDMSNVFLWHMVKKLRNGASDAVSPSVDLGPPVPEAPRVC